MRYAFFDGDNIGSTINSLLNNGRIEEATYLSECIKKAISQIEQYVNSIHGIELIIAGGDDILISYENRENEALLLKNISSIFIKKTGLSISCGVGNDVSEALVNLTNAKQKDKGNIYITKE